MCRGVPELTHRDHPCNSFYQRNSKIRELPAGHRSGRQRLKCFLHVVVELLNVADAPDRPFHPVDIRIIDLFCHRVSPSRFGSPSYPATSSLECCHDHLLRWAGLPFLADIRVVPCLSAPRAKHEPFDLRGALSCHSAVSAVMREISAIQASHCGSKANHLCCLLWPPPLDRLDSRRSNKE